MDFITSAVESDTRKKLSESEKLNRYYNASYEIENFIQIVEDSSGGDPFKTMTDPIYTGFKLFFHFGATSGLLASANNTNSALAYLKRIGHTSRHELLLRFITILSKVNSIAPWMFQDIENIQDLWSNKRSDILLTNKELNIKTLETVDGKMQSLIHMYREICWDDNRKVYILPENLRKFTLAVYVYDFRVFSDLSLTSYELLQTVSNTDVRQLNHTLFELGHCQFTEASGSDFFSEISNNRSEANTSNLTISYETANISSLFKSITGNSTLSANALDLVTVAKSNSVMSSNVEPQNWVDRLKQGVNSATGFDALGSGGFNFADVGKKLATAAGNAAINELQEFVNTQLAGLYLGNVYGFGLDDVRITADRGFDVKTIAKERIAVEKRMSSIKNNKSGTLGTLGNVND